MISYDYICIPFNSFIEKNQGCSLQKIRGKINSLPPTCRYHFFTNGCSSTE